MPRNRILLGFFAVLLVLIIGCSQDVKTYKVNYKENFPVGSFKAVIGNTTLFTNGNDILQVKIKKAPDFFCYAVNKQALCKFSVDVKISESAAQRYKEVISNLRDVAVKSKTPRTTLPERLNYYLTDEKLEVEDIIFINDIKNESIADLQVPVIGKGATEDEAKKDAAAKSNKMISVLTDKPKI